MFIEMPGWDAQIEDRWQQGDWEGLLNELTRIGKRVCHFEDLKGRALFFPAPDRALERLGRLRWPDKVRSEDSEVVLHVLSEAYATGGHTRLMEDVAAALPQYRHVVVLTDLAGRYRDGIIDLKRLRERWDRLKLRVVILEGEPVMQRLLHLTDLIRSLRPRAVFLNVHHFDAIAYGAVHGNCAANVIFLHHTDHNPSFGATRADYRHVDVTPFCHPFCREMSGTDPILLNMTVRDVGAQVTLAPGPLTGATCGSPWKYKGAIDFTYAQLLAGLFAAGVERMHHIGALPPEQEASIRQGIAQAGQDPGRMTFHPNTPSLTATLLELQPHFYMSSHPMGGGKATLEALSVGLPFLLPWPPGTKPLMNGDMTGGDAIRLSHLDEAPACVARLRAEMHELGARSRQAYERDYRPKIFEQALRALVG